MSSQRAWPPDLVAMYPHLRDTISTAVGHPGIRVGQIWAMVYRDGVDSVFTINEFEARHEWFAPDSDVRSRPLSVGPAYLTGDSWMPEEELRALLYNPPLRGYLIVDAACPQMAPWAPPQSAS